MSRNRGYVRVSPVWLALVSPFLFMYYGLKVLAIVLLYLAEQTLKSYRRYKRYQARKAHR